MIMAFQLPGYKKNAFLQFVALQPEILGPHTLPWQERCCHPDTGPSPQRSQLTSSVAFEILSSLRFQDASR